MTTGPGFETRHNGRVIPVPSKALERAAAAVSVFRSGQVVAIAEAAMERYLARVGARASQRHGRPFLPGSGSGVDLQRRSGGLVNAVRSGKVRWRRGTLEGVIAVPFYVSLHEFGGTIRAKGKYLAVPLRDALNPDGTPKKLGPREWRNATVIQSKKGNLLIVLKQGSRMVPLYVLKEAVKIPARLGLAKLMRQEAVPMQREIVMAIRAMVKKANSTATS